MTTAPQDAGKPGESEESVARAREAFRRGTALGKTGHWSDALVAFEHSALLRPHAVTTYNVAYCERALGRYTRARKSFAEALNEDRTRGGTELSEELFAAANGFVSELDGKIARFTVSLSNARALVSIDGAPLEFVAVERGQPLFLAGTRKPGPPDAIDGGVFDVLLDPGPHKFVAARAGFREGLVERMVEPGERGAVYLDINETAPPPKAVAPTPPPNRVAAVTALGIGGAGLAVGIVAGVIAANARSQLDDVCPDRQCGPEDSATLERANTAASISTAGFLVGGTAIATGIALWFLASKSAAAPTPPSSSVSVSFGMTSVVVAKHF